MTGIERRQKILSLIKKAQEPISSTKIKQVLGVSRQTITHDVALLRSEGYQILATAQGYSLAEAQPLYRLFKLRHEESRVEEELNLIVDLGGIVHDVIVNHKIYGKLSAPMNIKSRRDVQVFLNKLSTGNSSLLSNITSGYHFHHVSADEAIILDEIEDTLQKNKLLADVLPHEKEFF